jgi:hypothetical protein
MTKPPITAIAVLVSALLIAPSMAAAKTKTHTVNYAYRVTKATGSEVATFQGDGTSTCANAGLCGTSGTVSYTFGNANGGFALVTVISRGHRHTGIGDFEFGTDGTTSANVSQAGVAQPCVDSVKHRDDSLDVFISGSRVGFGLHGFNADLLASNYLAVSFPLKTLKRHRIDFQIHSNLPFHAGPFTGTLKVDATYTMVRDRRAERQFNKG